MKGSSIIFAMLLIGLASMPASASQEYFVQLVLNELAPTHAIGKSDKQISKLWVSGVSGEPSPISFSTETGYPVDVQTSYPEEGLVIHPIKTGLEAVVRVLPLNDDSEDVEVTLQFAYTIASNSDEPFVETSTATGLYEWTGEQRQTKVIPFSIDGKQYSIEVKASLFTAEDVDGGEWIKSVGQGIATGFIDAHIDGSCLIQTANDNREYVANETECRQSLDELEGLISETGGQAGQLDRLLDFREHYGI